nr:MAG TPA: hypothetical protein [Caudoviricetes sp.]
MEDKIAQIHIIKKGYVNTKLNSTSEIYWIETMTIPKQRLFRTYNEALDYINLMYDPDYEPEEPSYDN